MKGYTKIIGYDEHTPIIKAERRKDVLGYKFFCFYCNKNHYHGEGEGHRAAHCKPNENSPFLKTGYIITEGGYKERMKKNNLDKIKKEAKKRFDWENHEIQRGNPIRRYDVRIITRNLLRGEEENNKILVFGRENIALEALKYYVENIDEMIDKVEGKKLESKYKIHEIKVDIKDLDDVLSSEYVIYSLEREKMSKAELKHFVRTLPDIDVMIDMRNFLNSDESTEGGDED